MTVLQNIMINKETLAKNVSTDLQLTELKTPQERIH